MAKDVKPVPEGYHTVTPYLVQRDTKRALAFYEKAFGAETRMTMPMMGGRIGHAEIKIGDSVVFLSDEFPEMSPETKSPQTAGCVTGSLFLYVPDVDAAFKRAVDAGAKVVMPVTDMFWGDRFGKLSDPFGHHWGIATRKEDLSPQEIQKRQAEWEKQMRRQS
jgi:PhnB protein